MSGIGLILTGSILYTYLKDKEMQKNNRMKAAAANNIAMTPTGSNNGQRSPPPPEIVFDMADDKSDKDLAEADAFLADEEKQRQKRDL